MKVMNLVALLIAPAVVAWSSGTDANPPLRISIAVGAALIIVVAIVINKRKPMAISDNNADAAGPDVSNNEAHEQKVNV
jgi:K(+)-stimulated pyrophosphate-energized sodium pump